MAEMANAINGYIKFRYK